MSSCTPLTLADRMMRSRGRPISTAFSADSSADTTSASRSTRAASQGWARAAFSSIRRAASDWSSEPQLTPMRTGFP